MAENINKPTPRRPRRWFRRVLLLLAVVLLAAVALGPWLASRLAPGIIESAARGSIQGSVKVDQVALGWFTPTAAGPVELLDPKGQQVAQLRIDTPITLWQVVAGRWWSARSLDLGTITVRGNVDLIRYADGSTNLDAAIAPRIAAAKPAPGQKTGGSGSGGGGAANAQTPDIKARISITQLDATIRDAQADGKPRPKLGVQKLVGPIDFAIDQGSLTAKADLKADVVAAGGGSQALIKLDAAAKQKSPKGPAGFVPGNLERATVSLDAGGIPSALIDALGGFGGALQEGLGATSDTKVRIDGNLAAASITMQFRSPGATADAALKLADGLLVGAEPGKPALALNIRSTGFVARMPQAAAAVAQARQSLTLNAGPSVSLAVDSVRIPVPAGAVEGKPFDLGTLDFRNSGAILTLDAGAMSGRVALPAPGGDAASPSQEKPFSADPLRIVVDAADLARPVTVSGGAKATIEGRSAGDLAINASADGLLDAQGHLRALQKDTAPFGTVAADVSLKQFATALLQPFVGAMDLPLDLPQDAGPTLDLAITARTDAAAKPAAGAAGLAAIPPTDATVTLRSSNLSADVAAKLHSGVLRAKGEGVRVVMNSATPLARRVLAGDGKSPPAADIAGRAGVELTIADLVASLDALQGDGAKAPLAAVDGRISLAITDLRATLPSLPATDTQPAIAAEPISVPRATLGVVLARGQAPAVNLEAQAATTGAAAPMSLAANLTADGLKPGALPAAGGLDGLLALKLAGQIKATAVPPAFLRALPQLARYAPGSTAPRSDLDAAIAQAINSSVGAGADAVLTLGQPQGGGLGQVIRVQLSTQAQGVGTDLYARLTPSEAAITGGTTFLIAEPASINAILAAASPPVAPAAPPAPPAPAARPITLDSRNKFWLRMPEPIVVPLARAADGAITPDFVKAKDFFATLAAEGEIVASGIPIGSEPAAKADDPPIPMYTSARLGKLEAQARVPMAALASDSAKAAPANRASLKLNTDVRTGDGAPIAAVALDAKAGLDASSPEALVTLAGINTANVDKLLKRNGLVTGALGDKADIALRVAPIAGSAGDLALNAQVTSPAVSGASLSLAKRADSIGLTGPSNITWTPAPAFLNSFLVSGEESIRVTHTSPVTVNLSKFAIATGPEGSGPLKPGVFELDAQVAMPALGMEVPASAPADAKAPRPAPHAVTMNGISARTRWDPSIPALRESAPGSLTTAINIAGIAGNEGPAAKPSKITAHVRALADQHGNLTPDTAVVNADADLSMFPTDLIDQLANQGGLMTEVLGPTVSAAATARNVSQAKAGPRGTIEATVTSPRATAQLKGDLRRGQFVQTGPSQVRLLEIRPQLMQELAGSLPVIASMEKTTSDEPAMVEAKDLSVPLDKDMAKLSGVISIDPGVARFTTQSFLGSLLKAVGGRESGAIGRKIDPFTVRIDKGVATYDRFRLPLGEFSIETKGTVDLVNRKVNLVTYVPFFALTDEAMGPIKLGLGGKLDVLDRTTMVPITVKGSMDKPSAGVDAGLFLQETGSNLLQTPGRVLEGIGDLLGGKDKKKDEKKDEPKPK